MKGELEGLVAVVASWLSTWLWRLQSDTLGSSPTVAGISLFSFLPEQVKFQRNFYSINFTCNYIIHKFMLQILYCYIHFTIIEII